MVESSLKEFTVAPQSFSLLFLIHCIDMVDLQSSPISMKIVFVYKIEIPLITSLIFMCPIYTPHGHGLNGDGDGDGNMGMHNTPLFGYPYSKAKMLCLVLFGKGGDAFLYYRGMPYVHQSKVSKMESHHMIMGCVYGVTISEARDLYKVQSFMISEKHMHYGRRRGHANRCNNNEGKILVINKGLGFCTRERLDGCVYHRGKCLIIGKEHIEFAVSRRGYENRYVKKQNCLMINRKHIVYGRRMLPYGLAFMIKRQHNFGRKYLDEWLHNKWQWSMIKRKHFSFGNMRGQNTDGKDLYSKGAWQFDAPHDIGIKHNGVWKGPLPMSMSGFILQSKVTLPDYFAFLSNVLSDQAMMNSILDNASECPKICLLSPVQEPSPFKDVHKDSKETHEDSKQTASHADGFPVIESSITSQSSMTVKRKRPGEIIYKGHPSYDLMLNLQLGIRYSVGKVTPEFSRTLSRRDFCSRSNVSLSFSREGSQMTPPHQSTDFKWKDYRPMVFRHLRETFKIDAAEYMLSICGNNGLRELFSPGKSGSVFYLSHDERYMIKTLRKSEVKVLLRMLPRYYKHVQKFESTLLTRFLGLHRIKRMGGQKVRFIVMQNVVSTDSWIHKRFDLKGSSHGRSSGNVNANENTTLKDLDLDYVFQVERRSRDLVLSQVAEDCKFLESERIMDYSLLLAVHFKEPSRTPSRRGDDNYDVPVHETSSQFNENSGDFVEIHTGLKCLPLRDSGFKLGTGTLDDGDAVCLKSDVNNEAEIGPEFQQGESVSKNHSMVKVKIGSDMLASACHRIHADGGKKYYDPHDSEDVILYFGIIDILQEYDMGKKLEHAYKSFHFDSHSISAVNPNLYSRRFQCFMHEIFQYA